MIFRSLLAVGVLLLTGCTPDQQESVKSAAASVAIQTCITGAQGAKYAYQKAETEDARVAALKLVVGAVNLADKAVVAAGGSEKIRNGLEKIKAALPSSISVTQKFIVAADPGVIASLDELQNLCKSLKK